MTSSSAKAPAAPFGSEAVATMSRSLTESAMRRARARRARRARRRDGRAAPRRSASPTCSALLSSGARRGRLGDAGGEAPRARTPRTSRRSRARRAAARSRPPRAARRASRCPSSSKSLRARLGPRPGSRVMSIRPGGNFARSFSAAGIVPVSSSATIFSSSVLPIAGQRRDLALARQRAPRSAAPRAPPWPRCGRRARGGRRRRRARRGRRARRRARRWWRSADRASASAARVEPRVRRSRDRPRRGSSCPPTTRPRTSRRSSAPPTRVLAAAAPDGFRILVVDDDSPDGTGAIADRLAAELAEVEVLHRTRRDGLGPAYLAGFARALEAGAALRPGDGRRLLARPRRPRRACSARVRDGGRPRARLALRARRRRRRLGHRAPRRQPRRLAGTRARCSALGVRDLTGGFKCFRARGARGDRPAHRPLARLRLPGRADLPRRCARASASSRCRSSSATAGAGARRCPGGSRSRRSGSCPRLRRAGALQRPRSRPRGSSRGRPRRSRWGWRPAELALVQGIDDTRATLRALERRAVARRARGCSAALAIAVALLLAVLVDRPRLVARTPRRSLLPGPQPRPADLEAVGEVSARNALVLALHGMACVAGFIAGSSLPLQAEQLPRRVRAGSTTARARCAIAFVGAATLFSLATQAYVLGSGGVDARRPARHPPGAAAARRCCPTRCPSSSRSSSRSPPGWWPAAAARWDELLAATFATTLLAVPVVLLAAFVEVYVWPHLLRAVSPVR